MRSYDYYYCDCTRKRSLCCALRIKLCQRFIFPSPSPSPSSCLSPFSGCNKGICSAFYSSLSECRNCRRRKEIQRQTCRERNSKHKECFFLSSFSRALDCIFGRLTVGISCKVGFHSPHKYCSAAELTDQFSAFLLRDKSVA